MGEVREVEAAEITRAVRDLCVEVNYTISEDMVAAVKRAREKEESPVGRQILDLLIRNQDLAAQGEYPYCQDTGSTVVFIDVGQDVHITGGDLEDAINAGVSQGYTEGYLRGSIVGDPVFERKNTGDNTPAFIHTRVVPGDQITIKVDAKGGGSENKGRARSLPAGHHRRRDRGQLRVLRDAREARARPQGGPAEPGSTHRGGGGGSLRDVQRARHRAAVARRDADRLGRARRDDGDAHRVAPRGREHRVPRPPRRDEGDLR
jgi:hypothetical protein